MKLCSSLYTGHPFRYHSEIADLTHSTACHPAISSHHVQDKSTFLRLAQEVLIFCPCLSVQTHCPELCGVLSWLADCTPAALFVTDFPPLTLLYSITFVHEVIFIEPFYLSSRVTFFVKPFLILTGRPWNFSVRTQLQVVQTSTDHLGYLSIAFYLQIFFSPKAMYASLGKGCMLFFSVVSWLRILHHAKSVLSK